MRFSDLKSTALSQSHENKGWGKKRKNRASKRKKKTQRRQGSEHSIDGSGGLQLQHNKKLLGRKDCSL